MAKMRISPELKKLIEKYRCDEIIDDGNSIDETEWCKWIYKYCMEKLWERFFYALEDKNSVSGLQRLVNNAETMSAYFEANGILTEARETLYSLKMRNKKINVLKKKTKVNKKPM